MKQTLKTNNIITVLLSGTFFLSVLTAGGQTEQKQATVRIKKIETVNGVKKVTDTTYTTNDLSSIMVKDGTVDITGVPGEINDENIKVMIRENAGNRKMITGDKELDQQLEVEVENALKEAGIDKTSLSNGQKIVIINKDESDSSGRKRVLIKKTVIKKMDACDANENELKQLGQTGVTDRKLEVADMNLYPNPNTGKFNLAFNLPKKGDTEISVLNSEGKAVYKESLPAFSGNYDKEIDISKNAKGIYFVKVEQGKHSQVKKIVME